MRSIIAHAMELARSSDVDPELDREGHKRTLERLREKYGDRGHLQLWIPESPLRRNSKNSAGLSGNRKPCGAYSTSFLPRKPPPDEDNYFLVDGRGFALTNYLILTVGQPKSW